jgi:hypothetical protein
MEVGAQRDKFRVLQEHALALVRDYNKVTSRRGVRGCWRLSVCGWLGRGA